MRRVSLRVVLTVVLGSSVGSITPATAMAHQRQAEAGAPDTLRLSRADCVADVGQMTDFIELTHPDPYGLDGKLAYQRRLHRLVRSIPDDGLTRAEFHALLEPFVAAIGDGHTQVQPLRTAEGQRASGPGLPIDFRILAARPDSVRPALYIQGVAGRQPTEVAGARLEAVAGVPMAQLIERQRRLGSWENEAGNLQNLMWRLWSEQGLRDLLPEWDGGDSVTVRVSLPSGAERNLTLARGRAPHTWDGESAATRLVPPPTRTGEPVYRFLDADRSVALLRLDNTWAYREGFESLVKVHRGNLGFARQFYQMFQGSEPPRDTTDLIEGLPRATTVLDTLVEAMREAGTHTLIVDLRRNSGGSSMLVNMLLYYLHGRAGWGEFFGHFFTIRRLTPSDLAEDSSRVSQFPARIGDYDFAGEFDAAERTPSEAGSEGYWLSTTVSFAGELRTGTHEGYYTPPEVVAVVAPRTFSGGFWVAASLRRMGARLVGVPSGQAGNAFANVQYLTLSNSGVAVGVSSRLFVLFPEASSRMAVLPVDVPLTYERWRELSFDPNAELLQVFEERP